MKGLPYYRISKFFICIFLFYTLWFRYAYRENHITLYGSVVIATLMMLLDLCISHKDLLNISPYGVSLNLIMCLYSFLTGVWNARNVSALLSAVKTYFAFSIVCIVICYVSTEEKEIEWLVNIIIAICTTICIFQLINGYYYTGYGYVLGPTQNPNNLGITLCLGLFCLAYKTRNEARGLFLYLGLAILFIYSIVNCGSRKSFIAAIIISILWLYPFLVRLWEMSDANSRVLVLTFVLLALFCVYYYISRIYVNTNSFHRMTRLWTEDELSNEHRRDYYNYAIDYLIKRPVFGIGLAQFTYWNPYHQYAHSTFAEGIADWGIVGCILYFFPMIRIGLKLVWLSFDSIKKNKSRLIFSLWAMEMFLGVGSIWFYEIVHLIAWTIIFMYEKQFLNETMNYQTRSKYIKYSVSS